MVLCVGLILTQMPVQNLTAETLGIGSAGSLPGSGSANYAGGLNESACFLISLDAAAPDENNLFYPGDSVVEKQVKLHQMYTQHAPSTDSVRSGGVFFAPSSAYALSAGRATFYNVSSGTLSYSSFGSDKLYQLYQIGSNQYTSHPFLQVLQKQLQGGKKTFYEAFSRGKWKLCIGGSDGNLPVSTCLGVWNYILANDGRFAAERLKKYCTAPRLQSGGYGDHGGNNTSAEYADPNGGKNVAQDNLDRVYMLDAMLCLYKVATPSYRRVLEIYIDDFVEQCEVLVIPPRLCIETVVRVNTGGSVYHYVPSVDFQMYIYGASRKGNIRSNNTFDTTNLNSMVKSYNDMYKMFSDSAIISMKEIPKRGRLTNSNITRSNGWSWGQALNTGRGMKTTPSTRNVQWLNTGISKGIMHSINTSGNLYGWCAVTPIIDFVEIPPVGRQDIEADKPEIEEVPPESATIHKDTLITLELKQEPNIQKMWKEIALNNELFEISITLNRKTPDTDGISPGGTLVPQDPAFFLSGHPRHKITASELMNFMQGTKVLNFIDKTSRVPIAANEAIEFTYASDVIIYYGNEQPLTKGIRLAKDDGLAKKIYFKEEEPIKYIGTYTSTPEYYSEIKQGSPEDEEFEAMAGTPTTRDLYFSSGGSEFIVDIETEYVPSESSARAYKSFFSAVDCELNGSIPCNGHHGCDSCAFTLNSDGSKSYYCATPCAGEQHMNCNPHTVGGYEDSWTQTVTYDYMKINKAHVWKLEKSKVDGMYELVNQDEVTATIKQGDPSLYYNIDESNTAAGGRLYYSLESEMEDSVVWNLGESDNKHANSESGGPINEAEQFKKMREKTTGVKVISDFLILQTDQGDQAVMYYEKSGPSKKVTEKIEVPTSDFDTMWTNNSNCAAKWKDTDIKIGSYNGKYATPTAKYSQYSGSTVSTPFDGNNLSVKRPERPMEAMRLYEDNLDVPDSNRNGEYVTGDAQVFYSSLLSYGPQSLVYTSEMSDEFGGEGITYLSAYSPNHEKVNDVVIHNPVSVEDARILSLGSARDQRTEATKPTDDSKLVHTFTETVEKLDCKWTATTDHTAACYTDEMVHSGFQSHVHTARCYAPKDIYDCDKEFNNVKIENPDADIPCFCIHVSYYEFKDHGHQLCPKCDKYSYDLTRHECRNCDWVCKRCEEIEAAGYTFKKIIPEHAYYQYCTHGNTVSMNGGSSTYEACPVCHNRDYTLEYSWRGRCKNCGYWCDKCYKRVVNDGTSGVTGGELGSLGKFCSVCEAQIDDLTTKSGTGKYLCPDCKAYRTTHEHCLLADGTTVCNVNHDIVNEYTHTCSSPTCTIKYNKGQLMCDNMPLNHHVCDNGCGTQKVLHCPEPHHTGGHYAECYVEETIVKTGKSEVIDPDTGEIYEKADFLNLDYGFTLYFPNRGDFDDGQQWGIGKTSAQTGKGFTNGMDTTEWTVEKYCTFEFNVLYDGVVYPAGEKVVLPIEEDTFEMYCPLGNYEAIQAKTEFTAIANNNPYGTKDNTHPNNKERYNSGDTSLAAKHSAYSEQYIDIVGRIGNLTLEDTGDWRFSNYFKQPRIPLEWFVEGVVRKVDSSKQNLTVCDEEDIRGVKSSEATKFLNTYGLLSASHQMKGNHFPLTGKLNNIEMLRDEELRIGYPLYSSVQTIGNYGKGTLQIIPYYYYLELTTYKRDVTDSDGDGDKKEYLLDANGNKIVEHQGGALTPVDVYIQNRSSFSPINIFGACVPGWNPGIVYDNQTIMSWEDEHLRRNFFEGEAQNTQLVKDTYKYLSADGEIKDFATPSGNYTLQGNNQLLQLIGTSRTFIGTTSTYGYDKNPDNVIERELFSLQGQRWHYTTGLPSSAIFVKHGQPCRTENMLDFEDSKGVLIEALDIKAIGDTFTLQYDSFDLQHLRAVPIKDQVYDLTSLPDIAKAESVATWNSIQDGTYTGNYNAGVANPGASRPGVSAPGTGNPGTGNPGTGTPGTGTPGTGSPGTGNPGTGSPGTGSPGTGNPGTGSPGTGSPGTGTPGTGNPGTGSPGTGNPGLSNPDNSDNPFTNDPSTGSPGTGSPGTGSPGTGSPGTGSPGTGDPSSGDPSSGNPSSGTPSGSPDPQPIPTTVFVPNRSSRDDLWTAGTH